MPSVFKASRTVSVDPAIEEILPIAEHSYKGAWGDQVRYLPPQ